MRLISVLAAVVLAISGGVAQVRQPPGEGKGGGDGVLDGKAGKEAKVEKEAEAEELMRMTPEERLARSIIRGARGHCRIDIAVRPTRLLPGQTGRATVTMVFEGDSVMPSPPNLQLSPPSSAMLSFGGMTMMPPKPGRLAKAYMGQPVYDNYLILEMPVTMSPDAQLGSKQGATLELTFDLHSGSGGQPVGRFVDNAAFTIEVGAVADPEVAMPPATASPANPAVPTVVTTVAGGEPEAASKVQAQDTGAVAAAKAPSTPDEPTAMPGRNNEAPQVAEGGSSSYLVLGLGGAALVVLLLIALLRKA